MADDHLAVIVLAAGEGTRMRSALPKVLHEVCGTPMAAHVLNAARSLAPDRLIVVIGHGGELVRDALATPDITFVEQPERLGTGEAVLRCRDAAGDASTVLVLNGDEPLVGSETLGRLRDAAKGKLMAFTSQLLADAGALGRVQRDERGDVRSIVQAADWQGHEAQAEVNWGQYIFDAAWLWRTLPTVPVSPKGEYYLTKLADFAYDARTPAVTIPVDGDEALGVDDRVKLAEAEQRMQTRVLRNHMLAGVTIRDPETTYVDAAVQIEQDVTILPGCHLIGATTIAAGAIIGPNTTLRNASVGAGSRVEASVIEDSSIGEDVRVGPFAHVRGGAVIGDGSELGNYSEVKNSNIGRGVKMHHFSYVGDADVGDSANLAAGMITCNYDGVLKHRTTIGAGAFIGCDTMLIAPITIGEGALTGAGSVVTKDVPAGGRVAGVPARPLAMGDEPPER